MGNYPPESICIHAHRCRIHGLVKNHSFSFARTIIDNLCWSALPWTKAQQEENRSRGCPFVPGPSACVFFIFPCLSTCVCISMSQYMRMCSISMPQCMRMNFHVSAHAYVFSMPQCMRMQFLGRSTYVH